MAIQMAGFCHGFQQKPWQKPMLLSLQIIAMLTRKEMTCV